MNNNNNQRIFKTAVASVYPHYIAKAEKKGRTKEEVDEIICWLTGYSNQALQKLLVNKTDFETFLLMLRKSIRMYQKLPVLFAVTVLKT